MIELWLNFKDENGEEKRILVEGERFLIGRTPDNDLQIPLNNLSRQHAKIERFADVFIVSDCGSSNGTSLNDEKLTEPVSLKDEDKLNLADAVTIEVEIVSDKAKKKSGNDDGNDGQSEKEDAKSSSAAASSGAVLSGSSSSSSSSSMSLGFFLIAPVLGILVLLVVGAIFLLMPKEEPVVVQNNNYYSNETEDEDEDVKPNSNDKTPEKSETQTPTPSQTATPENSGGSNNQTTTPTPDSNPVEVNTPLPGSNDTQKIEIAAASFMRKIAVNDPRAFLTEPQIALVRPKINQAKSSSVLADNIKNAKKNAEALQTLAASRDLKPQFLANAAITKLGNQRGDVVAVAKEMIEELSRITKPFGNESADECLLVIAAYSGGKTGEGLQTAAGILARKFPAIGARRIRSIWFFKDNGQLDGSQFDYALRFLAIGAITQNPKDFNVQAEALQL